MSKRILLHCCCAPCATWCIEKLKSLDYQISLFFDNPNIYPPAEREKRFEWTCWLADYHDLELISGHTEHSDWLGFVAGYEAEKEGGARCEKCFEYNLYLASRVFEQNKGRFDGFTTSLTVSRFKSSEKIFKSAENFPQFIPIDFKKDGGFEKSCKISSSLGIYRQKYCGCEFSIH